jgi:hypothetical protein
MLGSMGTKNGIVLYHIGYNIVLGCPTISGVIGCNQPKSLVENPPCVTIFQLLFNYKQNQKLHIQLQFIFCIY